MKVYDLRRVLGVFALGQVSLVVGAGAGADDLAVVLALLIVVSVPFRFLQGWVLTRTGSLFAVGLVHAAGNATAIGSVLGAGLLPRMYDTDDAGGLVIPVLAVMGLVVLAATRGRLGLTEASRRRRPCRERGREGWRTPAGCG